MSQQYRFLRAVTVEGVPHAAGEVIDEADIPVGSLECLMRRYLAPVVAPETPPSPPQSPRQSKKKDR